MEIRRAQETAADYEQLRRDWILGSEQFRQELLAAASERVGPSHYGAQRQETAEQKAERILARELARLQWDEAALRMTHKAHQTKIALARLLREETTLTLKWIATRLHMGSWTYLSNLLHQPSQPQSPAQPLLPLSQ
jgi:hypothetical protein